MPLYEYQCRKCARRAEKIESVSGPHLKKCPHCGGAVERLLAAPAIQFKGAGWYVTDYAGKKSAGGDSSSPTKSGSGDSREPTAKETAGKDSKEKKTSKKKD